MKSVQAYISAQAAIRIHQQAAKDVEVKANKAKRGECNYDNDYYGDQICAAE